MVAAAAIRAGQAFVELGTRDVKLIAGLRGAQARLKAWGASITGIGLKLGGLGIALALPLAKSVTAFADYEQALANLRAATNPTAAEFDAMKSKIEEVAESTGTMPVEVANAFSELKKAGTPTKDIISDVGQALIQFAEVGQIDVAQATKALVGGLNIFSKKGVTASEVMNSINAAADASLISIKDATDAFSEGGGTMASFNQDIDDVNAAFAILGKSLIIGAEAGTTMKTLFLRLANPVGEVGEGLSQLGINVKDLRGADEQFLPLPEILDKIAAAADQLSPIARDQALTKIAGARGGRGLAVLLKEGSAGFASMKDEMSKALTVEQKYEVISNTLWKSLKKLAVQLTLAAIAVGETLAPALRVLGHLLKPVIANFREWVKQNRTVIMAVAGVTIGILGLSAALIIIGGLFSFLGSAIGVAIAPFTLLATVIGAALTPLGLIVIAAGLAGYALLKFTDVGKNALASLGSFFGDLKTSATDAWQGMADALAAGNIELAAQIALSGLEVLWLTSTNAIKGIWREFRDFILDGLNAMGLDLTESMGGALGALSRMWAAAVHAIASVWYGFITDVENGSLELIANLKKADLDLKAAMPAWLGGITAEEAAQQKQQVDEQLRKDQQAMIKWQDEKLNQHLAGLDAAIAAEKAAQQAAEAQIKARMEKRREAGVQDAEALAQAKEELEDLRAWAEILAAAKEFENARGDNFLARAFKAAGDIAAEQEQLEDLGGKSSVAGTFNALAAGGLGGGGPLQKIIEEEKKGNELLKKAVQALQGAGPLVFA